MPISLIFIRFDFHRSVALTSSAIVVAFRLVGVQQHLPPSLPWDYASMTPFVSAITVRRIVQRRDREYCWFLTRIAEEITDVSHRCSID